MKKWVVVGFALLFGAALAGAPSPAAAELKVGVSGYVKLDIQYSDKIATDSAGIQSGSPGATPLDPPGGVLASDNSQTIIDTRQSRLRVTFSDEVAGVKMSGRIETDFFTNDFGDFPGLSVSNSARLRLRHAFARADHPSGFSLLAGQYWSLFMNETIAQPDLVDFNGPAGQIFARQPQLRVGYKVPLAPGALLFEAAIEKHFGSNANLGSATVDESRGEGQTTPLFAGKVSWLGGPVQAEAAFAVADNTVILAAGNDVSTTATAFQASAQVNIPFVPNPSPPFATVFGHAQMIDGLGRLGNGDFPTSLLNVAGTAVENVESTGFYLGARFQINPTTSLNGVFGWNEADAITGVFGGAGTTTLETHQSIHANILHKFWERWQAGLEFRRIDVEAFNGNSGDVNIVHGALWFFF
jgi:hypothetical protein